MTTINELSRSETVADADLIPMWNTSEGDTRAFPASALKDSTQVGVLRADLADAATTTKGAALVGFTQPLTGATARTLRAKALETLTLTDFAGIDPTGVADSTAGFVAAMTASVGKRLYIPEGTYIINTPSFGASITDIEIVGAGWKSILKCPNASGNPVLRFEGASRISMRSLVIDGNQATQSLTTARALRIGTGSTDLEFENVIFQNSYYQAVFATGATSIPKRVLFSRCAFLGTNATNGSTVNLTDIEDFAFLGCYFTAWDYNAIGTSFFKAGNGGIRVVGCSFINTKSQLFAIETVASGTTREFRQRNVAITGNIFDGGNNATGGSGISGCTDNIVISGNVWRNSGAGTHRSGIESTGTGWVITGNYLDNGAIVVASTTDSVTTEFAITGNVIRNRASNNWAIMIGGVAPTEIADVVVTGNTIDLTGNTGSGGGIYVGTYGSPTICKRILVAGNHVAKTDTASGIGIRLRGAAGSESWRVIDNYVSGTSQGIRTDDSATDVEIARNNLAGTATFINFTHTTGVWRVYDNQFSKTAQQFISDDRGDANVTVTTGVDPEVVVYNTPLTLARTVTLSTNYAQRGARFRVVRTAAATGASTLSVGGLKTLAAGQWADVAWSGSAWILVASGSL